MSTPYRIGILLPTCGDPERIPSIRRLLATLSGEERASICLNPAAPRAQTEEFLRQFAGLVAPCPISVCEFPGPLGFGRAVNAALDRLESEFGLPSVGLVVVNDDAVPAAGWLDEMVDATRASEYRVPGGSAPSSPRFWTVAAESVGGRGVGAVGPRSNLCAGIAQVALAPEDAARAAHDPEGFTSAMRSQDGPVPVLCQFLSGFCLMLTRACLDDVLERVRSVEPAKGGDEPPLRPVLFREDLGIGGYEDNDLCARLWWRGWRCAIASTYVHHDGHATLTRHFPAVRLGLAAAPAYLSAWRGHPAVGGKRLVGVIRAEVPDLAALSRLRQCVYAASAVVDGIAVLLVGPPPLLPVRRPGEEAPVLPQNIRKVVDAWQKSPRAGARAMRDLLGEAASRPIGHDVKVAVGAWAGELRAERDQRNALLSLAEDALRPDWILALEPDEALEPRLHRKHLDHLMAHPDPLVLAYEIEVLTAWGTEGRYFRTDPPFGDGGSYRGAWPEPRLWRVAAKGAARVGGGVGPEGRWCPTAPEVDPFCVRVASIRLLRLGWSTVAERAQAQARAQARARGLEESDPTGALAFLSAEEGLRLSPYVEQSGIGLTMLLHSQEPPAHLARWLDILHGVVDDVVLVWTDPVEGAQGPPEGTEWARVAALYGARWVTFDLWGQRTFAGARNAGLDALRACGPPVGPLGWAYTVDPDEVYTDPTMACRCLRAMALCSDAHAFTTSFRNLRPPGERTPPSHSENVRFLRLDPEGVMCYHGRIHEAVDEALYEVLHSTGVEPLVRAAPFAVVNPGLALPDPVAETKLRRYQDLLVLELTEHPDSARAWTALALQYENDGLESEAVECYHRGVAVSTVKGYGAHRELALWHLRRARALFRQVAGRLPAGHPYRALAENAVAWLDEHAPERPKVGLARLGYPQPRACPPLPDFPDELVPPQAAPAGG